MNMISTKIDDKKMEDSTRKIADGVNGSMDIHEILKYLPHRYPFLLVDRVLSLEPGKDILVIHGALRVHRQCSLLYLRHRVVLTLRVDLFRGRAKSREALALRIVGLLQDLSPKRRRSKT